MKAKRVFQKVLLRKKNFAVVGAILGVTILAATAGLNATRSAYDLKVAKEGSMNASKNEISVTKVDVSGIADLRDTTGWDISSDSLLGETENTTDITGVGESKFSAFGDFSTYPGYIFAQAYKVENTGDVDTMNLSVELAASNAGTVAGAPAGYGTDFSDRIKYTVYWADDGKTFSKKGEGKLSEVYSGSRTVSEYIQWDSNIDNQVGYYVITFEFTDNGDTVWTGNNTKDNAFQYAKISFEFSIRAQQPVPANTTVQP